MMMMIMVVPKCNTSISLILAACITSTWLCWGYKKTIGITVSPSSVTYGNGNDDDDDEADDNDENNDDDDDNGYPSMISLLLHIL